MTNPYNYYSAAVCRLFRQSNPGVRDVGREKILRQPTVYSDDAGYSHSLILQCLGNPETLTWESPTESRERQASSAPYVAGQPPWLLDQVRARMRRLGLVRRTEEAYVSWVRRFILSQGKRHPRDNPGLHARYRRWSEKWGQRTISLKSLQIN